MLIREYSPADLDALRRIHARQGFDYAFPDLADPLFVSKLVVEDEAGRVAMASLARLTCEIYLLAEPGEGNCGKRGDAPVDRSGSALKNSPRERYARLLALHRAAERDLLARGLEDAHAWLPPPIARRFGRRLESLGWIRDDSWTPYCRIFRV
ncbi:MAG TPA: hypothetical protein VMJ93_15985 [Verrucomicrobiae bacterium]|nr:hypothetical protein [Verrucomicrobiae bacterium]